MQTIEAIKANDLTEEIGVFWTKALAENSTLASPYFRPEFTQAIARVRNDVEIAVIRENGTLVGLLPFQRAGQNIGRPVGGPLSDFQAVIGTSDLQVDPLILVRGCQLARWDFDHLLVSQSAFQPYHVARDSSPYLEVTGGYDAYVERRVRKDNDELKQAARRYRKIEREFGPLRFQIHDGDPATLATLFRWKSDQYRITQLTDVFAVDWTRDLLCQLQAGQHLPLAGVLSTLHAADHLVAVHFGMQSGGILHSWFPAYDPTFARYSPGILLLLEIIRGADAAGIERIELGKGTETYKLRLMTGMDEVAEGSVNSSPWAGMLRRRCRAAKQWMKNSRLQPTIERPARWMRHFRERALFD